MPKKGARCIAHRTITVKGHTRKQCATYAKRS